jgi:hypothetical protein
MRPPLLHVCLGAPRPAGLGRAIFLIFFLTGFCGLCSAQQANPLGRLAAFAPLTLDQVRDAAFLARPSAELNIDPKLLKITRRPDLEDLLSTIVATNGIHGLSLYQVEVPTQASFDGGWTWIVAIAPWRQEAYELFSFQSMGRRVDITSEFNQFASRLSLTLSKSEMANFGVFFLETAVPIRPGEVVLDQEALRDAVGRHYFTTYDEAWRSIDAYSRWWHAFLDGDALRQLTPSAEIQQDGRYRVSLDRVVTTEGAHPQLQQWQLEISPQGNVRVAAMRAVFPKTPRWIFYDSPSVPTGAPFAP